MRCIWEYMIENSISLHYQSSRWPQITATNYGIKMSTSEALTKYDKYSDSID